MNNSFVQYENEFISMELKQQIEDNRKHYDKLLSKYLVEYGAKKQNFHKGARRNGLEGIKRHLITRDRSAFAKIYYPGEQTDEKVKNGWYLI